MEQRYLPIFFQEYKAKCPSYFKEVTEETPAKTWDFKEQLVFERFDAFVERLKTIQEFCNTANQFLKLERVTGIVSLK